MVGSTKRVLGALVAGASLVGAAGCVSFRPIEPVVAPPAAFRGDATVPVEFVHPAAIGIRCAERGVKFLAMPGINANACANADLVTMPHPCQTLTGGWYASMLCHQIARANGWEALPAVDSVVSGAGSDDARWVDEDATAKPSDSRSNEGGLSEGGRAVVTPIAAVGRPTVGARGRPPAEFRGSTTVAVEFAHPANVALRCAERGAKMMDVSGAPTTACADRDLITMPNPCVISSAGWYASTLCHEMAHANGWPANHAGGRLFPGDPHGHSHDHEGKSGGEHVRAPPRGWTTASAPRRGAIAALAIAPLKIEPLEREFDLISVTALLDRVTADGRSGVPTPVGGPVSAPYGAPDSAPYGATGGATGGATAGATGGAAASDSLAALRGRGAELGASLQLVKASDVDKAHVASKRHKAVVGSHKRPAVVAVSTATPLVSLIRLSAIGGDVAPGPVAGAR